jgi:hypothetical protein
MRFNYSEEDLKHLNAQQLKALETNELYRVDELFQELAPGDEKDYRQYAREHFKPESKLNPLWHPCIVNECIKIINEFYDEEPQF